MEDQKQVPVPENTEWPSQGTGIDQSMAQESRPLDQYRSGSAALHPFKSFLVAYERINPIISSTMDHAS
eukprot:1012534-Pelagomonas_calceolata.AAC.1